MCNVTHRSSNSERLDRNAPPLSQLLKVNLLYTKFRQKSILSPSSPTIKIKNSPHNRDCQHNQARQYPPAIFNIFILTRAIKLPSVPWIIKYFYGISRISHFQACDWHPGVNSMIVLIFRMISVYCMEGKRK